MLNHYDELYSFKKNLPDWNRNLQHGRFDVNKDSMAEPLGRGQEGGFKGENQQPSDSELVSTLTVLCKAT